MAGPITHTIFAEKALGNFIAHEEKPFIVGNLFPDIRYLRVISRDATHNKGLKLKDVQDQGNAFKAGMLFHSLIDEAREDFVASFGAYKELPDSHLSTIALKICEDILLYNYSDRWPIFTGYLKDILPQEKEFGIAEGKIRQWHDMHMKVFASSSPTDNRGFFFDLGFDNEQINEIFGLVAKINERKIVEGYADKLYQNLQSILES